MEETQTELTTEELVQLLRRLPDGNIVTVDIIRKAKENSDRE